MTATALYGLSKTYFSNNDNNKAEYYGKMSLTILEMIGHVRKNEVKNWLSQFFLVDE